MGQTLLKTEPVLTREEAAEHLRQIADKLERNETLTLQSGEDSVSLDVSDQVEF